MSTDRDVTRIVRSWLEDGATALPDRVLDNVLDQLPATPQRRRWWPARRFREMNTPIRLAMAAAAVVLVAVVGINLLPRTDGVGPGATPVPTATPSPTTTPSATPAPYAEPTFMAPGSYIISPTTTDPGYTFTVADGWEGRFAVIWKGRDGPGETAFGLWRVANVYTDPCHWQQSLLNPPLGPAVADLTTAFLNQDGPGASPATDVTFGGYPAKRVELSIPTDLDVSTCDLGKFRRFRSPGEGDSDVPAVPAVQVLGRVDVFYIIDIDGARWVIYAWYLPGTPEADVAELEASLASIEMHPPTTSP
jgi:hypothetical protein